MTHIRYQIPSKKKRPKFFEIGFFQPAGRNWELEIPEKHRTSYRYKTIQAGFTLVELLAVLAIFTTIAFFITSIIISTLRNTNKTNAVATVQANGNYAITTMSKLIRGARSLTPSDTCGTLASPSSTSSLGIVGTDGNVTTFSCTTDAQSHKYIASNSAVLTDTSLVKWVSCQFTCGRNSVSDYPVIGIKFSLQYVSGGSSSFTDEIASSSAIPFQTSVIMRNLER